MILAFHVVSAIASLILATYTVIVPGNAKLRLSAVLVALTFASGAYIIAVSSVKLLPTCLSGLLYLAFVSAELMLARYRLAKTSL